MFISSSIFTIQNFLESLPCSSFLLPRCGPGPYLAFHLVWVHHLQIHPLYHCHLNCNSDHANPLPKNDIATNHLSGSIYTVYKTLHDLFPVSLSNLISSYLLPLNLFARHKKDSGDSYMGYFSSFCVFHVECHPLWEADTG